MALSIKDDQTDQLVRRYARLHRITYTGAIRLAVSDALRREGHAPDETEQERIAREFVETVRAVQTILIHAPVLDPRAPDEILYDAEGLPR